MRSKLTTEEIADARRLRIDGKTYPEIIEALNLDVEPDTVRQHCLDLETRSRTDKPERQRKDGGVIRTFTAEEDAALRNWHLHKTDALGLPCNLNALAKSMGRKRHSLDARLKTLKKKGLLPEA